MTSNFAPSLKRKLIMLSQNLRRKTMCHDHVIKVIKTCSIYVSILFKHKHIYRPVQFVPCIVLLAAMEQNAINGAWPNY